MFVSWVTGDARVVDSLPRDITRPGLHSVVRSRMHAYAHYFRLVTWRQRAFLHADVTTCRLFSAHFSMT